MGCSDDFASAQASENTVIEDEMTPMAGKNEQMENMGVSPVNNVNWCIYEDGTLVINGDNKTSYKTHNGIITQGKNLNINNDYSNDTWNQVPWVSYRNNIKSVEFASETKPISMSYWFYYCVNLKNINSENLDTSSVRNLDSTFAYCNSLTDLNGLESWDTSKVETFGTSGDKESGHGTFSSCIGLTDLSALSNWKFDSAISTSSMFAFCNSLTNLNGLENWSFPKTENLYGLFSYCNSLTDVSALSNWTFPQSKDMSSMFSNCEKLTNVVGIEDWDIPDNTKINYMFANCPNLRTLHLEHWDVSYNTEDCGAFQDDSNLETIYCNNIWRAEKSEEMFDNCTSLSSLTSECTFDSDSIDGSMSNPFTGYFTYNSEVSFVNWCLYEDGTLVINGNNEQSYNGHSVITAFGDNLCIYANVDESQIPWNDYRSDITSVEFANNTSPKSMEYWFYNCSNLFDINMNNLDTKELMNLSHTFSGCSALKDLSFIFSLDLSNVNNMSYLFNECSGLTDIEEIRDFDISNVSDLSYMFSDCPNLTNINLSNWIPKQKANVKGMFLNDIALEKILCQNDWSNIVIPNNDMFENCPILHSETTNVKWNFEHTGSSMSNPTTGYFTDPTKDNLLNSTIYDDSHLTTNSNNFIASDEDDNAISSGRNFEPTYRYSDAPFTSSISTDTNANLTSGVTRTSDPSTMDNYQDFLDISSSSRQVGRVWTDKSVFATGSDAQKDFDGTSIIFDEETDGLSKEVESTGDFMHVYSVLGSSQILDETTPMDVMLILDISGSMGNGPNSSVYTKKEFEDENSVVPAVRTIKAANEAIKKILSASKDSRIGISVYGSTAVILLPLGHYELSSGNDVLTCTYLETYGQSAPQGAHFRVEAHITNKYTKEQLAFAVDNAGQTSNQAHGLAGTGNRLIPGTGGHLTGHGTLSDPYHVGHITNQQAGLACAMEELASEENTETTWVSLDGTTKQRMPAIIHLTDGQASDIAWIQEPANPSSPDPWVRVTNNWYNVDCSYDQAYNLVCGSGNAKYSASQMSSTAGDVAVVTFQTILTGSYYKARVNKHYTKNVSEDQIKELTIYSIYASDTSPYEDLDPLKKSIVDLNMDPSTSLKDYGDPASNTYEKYIDTTYELLKRFKNGETITDSFKTANATTSKLNANLSQIAGNAYGIVANDIDFGYVKAGNFYHVSFSELSGIFDTIVSNLMNEAFVPIDNTSNLNTENSISYTDPIGDLMDVNSVNGMVLFGSYYPITCFAIYDPVFIAERNGFQQGWYKGEDASDAIWGGTGTMTSDGTNVPTSSLASKTYSSSADAYADGWRYIVNETTATSFISNLNVKDKENTIYTIYSFSMPQIQQDELRMNSIYGTEVPFIPSGSDHTKFKGIYALSDIHIWTEDTSKVKNVQATPDNDIDLYDESLCINIPANALPLRVAHIGGSAESGYVYSTNLDSPFGQALPLRILYSVSVSDSIKNEAGEIDFTKVPTEYRNQYQVKTTERQQDRNLPFAALEFRSNYYNMNNSYDDYATNNPTGDYTFGNPFVRFLPSNENPYYVVQRPLTVYDSGISYVEGTSVPTEISILDNTALDKFKTTYPTVNTELVSDRWYYMLSEYYEVIDGVCQKVSVAIPRKGSDFGITQGNNNIGVSICWLEQSNGQIAAYTQDATHGKPSTGSWVIAASRGNVLTGNLSQSVVSKGGDKIGKYVSNNVTRTSNNVLLATATKNIEENNIEIDAYLGNNGMLSVSKTVSFIPQIQKQVVDEDGDVISEYDFTNNHFDFTISAASAGTDIPIPNVASTDERGIVTWNELTFPAIEGIYEYIITENKGEVENITYDSAEHKLQITINSDLSITAKWDNELIDQDTLPVITNHYSSSVSLPESGVIGSNNFMITLMCVIAIVASTTGITIMIIRKKRHQ